MSYSLIRRRRQLCITSSTPCLLFKAVTAEEMFSSVEIKIKHSKKLNLAFLSQGSDSMACDCGVGGDIDGPDETAPPPLPAAGPLGNDGMGDFRTTLGSCTTPLHVQLPSRSIPQRRMAPSSPVVVRDVPAKFH